MNNEKNEWVKASIFWSLGQLKSPEAVPLMEEVLNLIDAQITPVTSNLIDAIVDALSNVGTPEAFLVLRKWQGKTT